VRVPLDGQNRGVVLPHAEPTAVRPAGRGEGPVWDHRAGELLWADAVRQEIRWARVEPDIGVRDVAVRQVGEPVSAVTPTTGTDWLLAAGHGLRALAPDGRIARLLDLDAGTRMGAGAADRAGRFFAGAMGAPEEPGSGALWRVDLDGVVSEAVTGLTAVTGIGWSPGDDVVYLAEGGAGTVTAFEYDADLGTLGAARVVVDVAEETDALLQGLALDRAGHVWVPLRGAGEVRRYSTTGVLEDVVPVRATRTSGCAFAGPQLDVLVITTSAERLSAADRAVQPDAGTLFITRVPDVVGQPAFRYRGPLTGLTRAG
jgi:sugar lactone lactonase YvrE